MLVAIFKKELPQPTGVARLDSDLAHASDHLQKGIPLLRLETGSLG
jgi:hypothetical protein